MTWYDASFGSAQTGLGTVGVTEYDNTGSIVVARTTVGVVETGGGCYGRDFTRNAATAQLLWDTGGGSPIFACESVVPYDERDAINTDTDQLLLDVAANLAAINGLNDIDIADVQTALTNQGYTAARAPNLDNLDAAISSLNDLSIGDVQTALTNQGYTAARAPNLDNLDVTVSSRNAVTPMAAATSQAEHDATQAAIAGLPVPPTAIQNADALLNRDMSAVTVTNSRSPINGFRFLRNRWEAAALALTVYEEDDTTVAWTSTLTADPLADPVVQSDPA